METAEHLRMVREAGCDLAQGWLLGHAMPAEEIPGWVRAVQAAGGDLCALAARPVRGGPRRVIGRRPGRRATAPAGRRPTAAAAVRAARAGDGGAADCSRVRQPRRRPRDPCRTPELARRRTAGRGRSLDLLIWDAPNIDMTLSTVIGARPTAASRPRFDAIAAWFVEGAGDPSLPDAADVEACVFANIPPQPGTLQRWVEALRGFGFAVFARPKTQPDDDIDQDMLDHIAVRAHSHRLRRLVVFSGDGRNFAEPLEQLVREGTHVVVVAFSEVAGYAISSELLEFIDIEDVPGAFVEPLDRVRLDALPAGRRVAAAHPQPARVRQQLHRPPGPLTGSRRSPATGRGRGTSAQAGGRPCRWRGVIAGPFRRLVAVLRRGDVLPRTSRRARVADATPALDRRARPCASSTTRSPGCGTSWSTGPAPRGLHRLLGRRRRRAGLDRGRPHRRRRSWPASSWLVRLLCRRPDAAGDLGAVAAARSAGAGRSALTFVVLAIVQAEIAWMIPQTTASVLPARLHPRHLRQRLHPRRPPALDRRPRRRLLGRPGARPCSPSPVPADARATWRGHGLPRARHRSIAVLAHVRRYALNNRELLTRVRLEREQQRTARAARPAGAAQPRGPAHRAGQPPALGRRAARASAPRPGSATPSSASCCSTSTTSRRSTTATATPAATRRSARWRRCCRRRVRAGDLVARLGGDELAVLLPGSDLDRAVELAERLRCEAAELVPAGFEPGEINLSLGRRRRRAATEAYPLELMSRADEQLYRAKITRNAVGAPPAARHRSRCRGRRRPHGWRSLPGIPCFVSQSRAAWATSAQPESTVSECPRSGNSPELRDRGRLRRRA